LGELQCLEVQLCLNCFKRLTISKIAEVFWRVFLIDNAHIASDEWLTRLGSDDSRCEIIAFPSRHD